MEDVEGGPTPLSADVREGSDGPVVVLAGELDLSNVGKLEAAVQSVLAGAPRRLDFDLERLDFMDSSGLAVLIRAASQISGVRVLKPSERIRRLLEMTGVSDMLEVGE